MHVEGTQLPHPNLESLAEDEDYLHAFILAVLSLEKRPFVKLICETTHCLKYNLNIQVVYSIYM